MKLIPNAVSTKLARQTLRLQKNSPQILFGAGIVGMVGSTVLACRATLQLSDTLEQIHTNLEIPRNLVNADYSDKDRQHDIMVLKVRGAVAIGRLYAPSAALGVMSVAALTKSHHILSERNAALMAAYAALDKGFDEYRARVTDRYGEDIERELRYGSEERDEVDEKTGRKKKVTRVSSDTPSIYARFFDPLSSSWSKEPEYNRLFLKCQQNWANDMLHARGHVFLNEVYDSLGLERSKAGAVVGWVLSEDSDNFVDFGVFRGESTVDFVNGREGSILLDFNVDGVIFDKIEHGGEAIAWQA
jgi:hypothetical protein